MDKGKIHNIYIGKLTQYINEVRDVLNEICITIDENENKEYILKVSEYLDELIIEYMKRSDTKNEYINLL